jgi:uncharacterized protein with HEPN domain
MSEPSLVLDRLENILEALERIPARLETIETAVDFQQSEDGRMRLDAICMILIAVGETFKQIDHKTNGALLLKYPDIDWRGVKGVRDVMAHRYFDIDAEQVFNICQSDIPQLTAVVRQMIQDERG